MKRNILKMTLICTIAFFLAAAPIANARAAETQNAEETSAADGELYYVNTQKGLNMRSGPATSYEVVTLLPYGTEVLVTERTSDGWYKVVYSGYSGYVSADYLTKVETADVTDDAEAESLESLLSTELSSELSQTSDSKNTFGAAPIITALIAAIVIMLVLAVITALSFFKKDKDYYDEAYDEEDAELYEDEDYDNSEPEYDYGDDEE